VSRKLSAQEGVERARFFYYLPRANEPGSFRLASLQQNFSQPISYGQLFRRLFHGPDETFRDGGYLSALPRELRLLGLEHRSEDGILRLNVSRHLEEGGGKLVYLRLQQLVFTALELPGVRRVELLVEGRRRSHLSGDGVVIPRYLDGEFFRGRDILADSG
jgi:spore germination protein GerM